MLTPSKEWLFRLTLLPGIGPRWFQENAPDALRLRARLQQDTALVTRLKSSEWNADVDRLQAWLANPDHHMVSYLEPNYPAWLRHIHAPPPILFGQGNWDALSSPCLAIVGARQATLASQDIAAQWAQELVAEGITVVSGLAKGIDAAAHQGALQGGGATVAVLGHGLDTLYPIANTALAESMLSAKGLLLSEFPLKTPIARHHFPQRNRIIAGLSRGVVILEAALKSGSLITARYALNEGRDVFAVPGPIKSPLTKGCHVLIKEGAILAESVDDILNEL